MKKSIDIHGISTTATYTDGDLQQCVNLRKKNGVHKPVTPRKVTRTTTEQYVYTFQHNLPQTGENLIGVRNNNIYHVKSGLPGQPDTETPLTSTAGFKSITQIGNLLQVLDETGIKVLWWIDTEYKLIESNFGGGQTASELLPVKVDLKVDAELGNVVNGYQQFNTWYIRSENRISVTDLDLRKETAKALYIKMRGLMKAAGLLHGFCFACTAIELFDGSYILQSQPILLGQTNDIGTRYSDGTNDYVTNQKIVSIVTQNGAGDKEENGIYYISFAGIDYPNTRIGSWNPSQSNSVYIGVNTFANKLKFKVSSTIDEKFRMLIKSISVFVTPEIDMLDETKQLTSKGVVSNDEENIYLQPKTNAEILKELSENQQFYKVHEIPFDELKTTTENGGWITIDLKGKLGESLIMQEELPVDNFTHHGLMPNAQMVYNSKLHIMDYKQELFHGWPYEYFEQKEVGIGQFNTYTPTPTTGGYPHWWAEVKIKTENGTSVVVRHKATQYGTWERNTYANTPMLSYPDSRAYEITLYIARFTTNATSGYNKTTYKLTPSETHNFAYYISPDLKPITYSIAGTPSNANPPEVNRTVIYRNAMKVSSVNNPFYFPPATTFIIGTGILLNAGTNAQRMSEGQFGQYDLYVLTSEGLYSLDTGTTIAYNRQSPASLEIPTSAIICATPFGVVFVGKRGLYVINGQQTSLISPQIEQDSQADTIYGSSLSFVTFLKTIKDILYDPNQNELIVVSTSHDYNWVLNIDSKMWYMSTEKIDFEVKNSSPNLLVVAGKDIKDYSQANSNQAAVALITRPIYFGIDEVKQLQRGILRGRVYQMNTLANSNAMFYRLFGSNDGTNHTLLRGFRMLNDKQDRDYKDFDSGMIARSTYRNYSVAFEATIDERSEISHIDFEVADNYNNDKLR